MSTPRHPEVTSITAVPTSMAEDQGRRLRQYMAQMGLRIVLIMLAAFFVDGWLLWVCIAGAIVLPYTAVIFANAGRDRTTHEVAAVPPVPPTELPATPTAPPAEQHRVVEHRVVDHQEGDQAAGTDDTDDTDRKDDD